MSVDEIKNRKRCLQCKHYGMNVCPLMADADVFKIDKCILEYDKIKSIKEGTLDWFVFLSNPKLYLSYIGYMDKENYPKIGETVLTLTSGFSSRYSGKFLHVASEDSIQIFLEDSAGEYCVSKESWWKRLFKVEKESEV